MESHEAKNTMKLLALVFISLAACLLQGERDGGFGYSSTHGGIKRQAVRQADMLVGEKYKVADGQLPGMRYSALAVFVCV